MISVARSAVARGIAPFVTARCVMLLPRVGSAGMGSITAQNEGPGFGRALSRHCAQEFGGGAPRLLRDAPPVPPKTASGPTGQVVERAVCAGTAVTIAVNT